MKIRALPEFINLFKDSRSTSTQNGRSHFLIRLWETKSGEIIIKVKERN